MSNHLNVEVREKTIYLIAEFGGQLLQEPPPTVREIPTDLTLIAVGHPMGVVSWAEYILEDNQLDLMRNDTSVDFLVLPTDVVRYIVQKLPVRKWAVACHRGHCKR